MCGHHELGEDDDHNDGEDHDHDDDEDYDHDDDDDEDHDHDDDENGYPAHSHHDKFPPWWVFVRDDYGGNLSICQFHH